MSGGFTADQGVIEETASILRSGADSLESSGRTPPAPDAGELTGVMGSVMSKLVNAAGELSTGTSAAADAVAEGGRTYAEADDAAKQSLPQVE